MGPGPDLKPTQCDVYWQNESLAVQKRMNRRRYAVRYSERSEPKNRVSDGRAYWRRLARTVARLCAAAMSALWAILFYFYFALSK